MISPRAIQARGPCAPVRQVAFIGLGAMGQPMATRIQEAGFQVLGYHPRPTRARALRTAGIPATTGLRKAVRGADLVATMLPGPDEVWDVLAAPGGVFSLARPGTLVVDFSTIGPELARELWHLGDEVGIGVLDAPVSGGVHGAVDGNLGVMVGGSASDFEMASSVLTAVAARVQWMGAPGNGQVVKAANQLIVAGTLGLISEALVLLRAHGIDLEAALRILGSGQASSAIMQSKGKKILVGDFSPRFRLELMAKDLKLVRSAIATAGVALPLADLCTGVFAAAVDSGYGNLDCSAVIRQIAGDTWRDSLDLGP